MGGSASKKENFPDISLTQEQIDIIYSNFSEFTKLKDGKSGDYISEKGLQKVFSPNKQIGKKVHTFLANQSVSQTLDFDTFLGFVEFFLFNNEFQRKDVRFRDYSILELYGLISFHSPLTKNKHTDKDYINRVPITFRAAFDFIQELHGLVASCGQKKEKQPDETIPKKITTAIFEELYELPFGKFIEQTYALIPNAERLVKGYFKRLLYDTDHKLEKEKQKEEGETHTTHKEQRSAFSGLFNHNNLSMLTFTLPDFPDLLYREKIYDGNIERFNYNKLSQAFNDGSKYNLIFLLSHQVQNKAVPKTEQEKNPLHQSILLSNSLNNSNNQIQTQVLGMYLPKTNGQSQNFFQLTPDLHIFSSYDKQKFLNIDQSAAVVFFGEGEEDILFLHNDLLKESYVKSNFPGFSENGTEPQILKISQIEIWALSDDPIVWKPTKQSQPTPTQTPPQQASPQEQKTSSTVTIVQKETALRNPQQVENTPPQQIQTTPQYVSSNSLYVSNTPQYTQYSPSQYTPTTYTSQPTGQYQYQVVESRNNNQISQKV